ncbi:zinc finger protein GAI-ASSOCIATED FACTOR 1-like [Cornus florida]|uniref:zinc finger protein GAI-ASSOCIATED FACTOR 1-like n=1 Tax=Cornus florida TaxID=4283 RepID=UPI00289E87F7|nr:zinc finger protein GAI-ASSOCIATED FACTOR 1-like [Cornus florida]
MEFENTSPMKVCTATGEASIICSTNQSPPPATTAKKKRSLPGMPDPSAEVIALSPETLMATNRFVCEICNKGFQRDQNLQLHRRGHNLPWKLRQRAGGEVRKRVYVCPEPTCVHHDRSRALGDLTGIKKHFCRKHGEKKWNCERCSKKYAVKSDWKAHMKTCGTREYRCDCGTVFSRRDSFVTHRAFCDVLANESRRTQTQIQTQTLAITSSEETLKGKTVASSSFSPPPPPLTPSTTVLSPVLSIQSSELPENTTGLSQQQPIVTPTAAVSSGGSTFTGTANRGGGVFASIFASPTSASVTQSSQSPSSFSDLICAMATSSEHRAAAEPISLSLSSSLYLSNNTSSLFAAPTQDLSQHYARFPPQPTLSATALLQKAAQMGAKSSNSSFLRGLGLALPSSSDHQDNTTTNTWSSNVKSESNSLACGLGLGLASDGFTDLVMSKPTTLDLLGLGIGGGGASNSGFTEFINSIGGGGHISAAASAPPFGGLHLGGDGTSDTKPSMH